MCLPTILLLPSPGGGRWPDCIRSAYVSYMVILHRGTMPSILQFLTLLVVTAALLVPVVFGSHKLVPGLNDMISKPFTNHQKGEDVTNLIKRVVTECSADIYVLVDIPGLESSDLTDKKQELWPNLVKYLHMLSTVAGYPWVDTELDFAFLEKYITKTCKAETIEIQEAEQEMSKYLDTRKRVVRVDLAPLPYTQPSRDETLRSYDALIRKILGSAPSPHYYIVVSLSTPGVTHHIPDFAIEQQPEHFNIFHSIILDPRRDEEVERNKYLYKDVEPYWNEEKEPMKLYLERRKKDQVHFFDSELWEKHEQLVLTVMLMVASLVVLKVVSFGRRMSKRLKKD